MTDRRYAYDDKASGYARLKCQASDDNGATTAEAECSRLQERVRVLEAALRGIRACALDQRRMHEVNRDGIECTGRLNAIEHYVWAALEGIE